jgi:hypothetical protein
MCGGALMSRGPQAESQVGRIVAGMKVGECEPGRAIATRMGLEYSVVHAALTQRAKFIKDVVRMPEGFIRLHATPKPKVKAVTAGEDSRSVKVARDAAIRARANKGRPAEIVQPRTPPPFREWKPGTVGHVTTSALCGGRPAPIRPGADDYRAVPSLYGDQRVQYQGARPVATTATGAGARSGVK